MRIRDYRWRTKRKAVGDHSLSSVGQVQAHDAVVRFEHRRVDGKVSGGTRVRLDVDPPQSRVQVKGVQGALLAQQLDLIHHLRSTVVSEGDATGPFSERCSARR